MMQRIESLALALANYNGAFDNISGKAFQLCNPGLLKSYRPEKKVDAENYRVFTSMLGGFKALVADLSAKCSGKNQKLSPESALKEMLVYYGVKNAASARQITLFVQRALGDDMISERMAISFFVEESKIAGETQNGGRD